MTKNLALKILGLSENEAKTYMLLLSHGSLSASDLVKKSSLHRPSVYKALETLAKRELVNIVPKGKRQHYRAASPEIIEKLLADQFALVKEEIVPMQAMYERNPRRPKVTYFEGRQAVSATLLDIPRSLKKGDVFYRYSSRTVENDKQTRFNETIRRKYRNEREAKKLERYVISNEAKKRSKQPLLEVSIKTVPKDYDLFDFEVTQIIYGDKVLLIDYNSWSALLIENPMIAHFQKRIFQLLFRLL